MINLNGSKSMEKLSSGFRINKAGDDAAGLAVFEKIRDKLAVVIKFIQSFSKIVLYNRAFIQNLIKLLKDNKQDSLAFMSILVKN